MSIWEALLLIEKKKLEVHEDFRRWYARTAEDLALEEAAVTSKVVHEMRSILPHHRDPADRFLADTAITYDLVLVTAHQKPMAVPGLRSWSIFEGWPYRWVDLRFFRKKEAMRFSASAVASGR
jgi:PIN domain nuclease of toxin-antitoxin system